MLTGRWYTYHRYTINQLLPLNIQCFFNVVFGPPDKYWYWGGFILDRPVVLAFLAVSPPAIYLWHSSSHGSCLPLPFRCWLWCKFPPSISATNSPSAPSDWPAYASPTGHPTLPTLRAGASSSDHLITIFTPQRQEELCSPESDPGLCVCSH